MMNKLKLLPAIWVPGYAPTATVRVATPAVQRLAGMLDACARSPDGFGVRPGGTPYLETCEFAVNIMSFLAWCGEANPLRRYRDACLQFVRRHQCRLGGFADTPGGKPLVFATYYCLAILAMLDDLDEMTVAACRDMLHRNARPTGLPSFMDFPPESTTCFFATVAAAMLGAPVDIYGDAILNFYARCRKADGSYPTTPAVGQPGRLQATAEAVLVSHLFSEPLRGAEGDATRTFIASCLTGSGQFDERPGVTGSPRDTILGSTALFLLFGSRPSGGGLHLAGEDLWQCHAHLMAHLASHGNLGIVGDRPSVL